MQHIHFIYNLFFLTFFLICHYFDQLLRFNELCTIRYPLNRMGDIPLRQNNRVPPPRPIIVRFQHFCDRQLVWGQRFKLAGKLFSINENFARAVEHRRTKLYPILSTAKKSGNYKKKAYLNGDKLRIYKSIQRVNM